MQVSHLGPRMGYLVGVMMVAQGCAPPEGSKAGPADSPMGEAREQETVLGFEAADAWHSDDGQALQSGETHLQGRASLAVPLRQTRELTSSPFKTQKTPNQLALYLQWPESATGRRTSGRIQAMLECKERGVSPTLLGSADSDATATNGFAHTRFKVPEELQENLAGGCSDLAVRLLLNTDESDGTLLLDGMSLRARTPTIDASSEPLCQAPNIEHLRANAVETPDGYWDYESWFASAVIQAELPGLDQALRDHADTVLGITPDHLKHQVVVVVDGSELQAGRVQRDLQSKDIALPLRFQPSCHPLKDVRAVRAHFETTPWPEGTPAFAGHTDPQTGQYVVTYDPGTEPSSDEIEWRSGRLRMLHRPQLEPAPANLKYAKDIEARFGPAVHVRWGRPGRHGRLDDGERHYGGAGIGPAGLGNMCTSGFVVTRNGAMGSITAGHCFLLNSLYVYSGDKLYGYTDGIAPYPAYDMIRIDPGTQRYTNTIHTGPSYPVTRVQIAKADPVIGNYVCISGMVTGAKCSVNVISNDCSIFNVGMGLTTGLTLGIREGVILSQPGDSGAPIYTRSGSYGAIINGMNNGAGFNDETCFSKVSVIEAQLGVQVAL